MEVTRSPLALVASDVKPKSVRSNYPEPFRSRMQRRLKRPLGDAFGIKNFGVNLTCLEPGGESALLHRHSKQDEFIYVLAGRPTLMSEGREIDLRPGMCAGFSAGGAAHQLVNRTSSEVSFIEMGDRCPDDEVCYPCDDLAAFLHPDGTWSFRHGDGRPY